MKKCPKCGTILDDSKKTCYMCGTVLQKSSITNFGESFNEQIGATISSAQDNAFNNTKSSFGSNIDNVGAVNTTLNEIRDIKNSNSDAMFSNQMDSLNSLEYDSNKSAIEKLFEDDSRFKRKNSNTFDFDEMISGSTNKNKNETNFNMPINSYNDNDSYDNTPYDNTSNNNVNNNNQMFGSNDNNVNYGKAEEKGKSINWGSNLTGNRKSASNLVIGKLSPSLIFNTICFIVFIGLMCFVYFKYIRSDNTYKVSDFGGLYYSIDKSFKLESDDQSRKLYSRGDSCSVSITYGTTTDVEGYVDEYFNQLTEQYKDKEMHTSVQEISIGTNKWQELTVVDLKENPTSSNGEYSTLEKYKYISIVYRGNYYTVIYANLSLDNDCSLYYNKFRDTLAFK